MRKLIIPILIACLSVSFTIMPSVHLSDKTSTPNHLISSVLHNTAANLYSSINLAQFGLSQEAFEYAYKGYEKLISVNKISRCTYLTICDFSQSSKKKRFYIIDIPGNKLIINTYVAHGRNSGGEFAEKFSNKPESLESSLGFYLTQNTYTGEHGLSLKIIGLEKNINDKALQRNIVIHGAEYMEEGWLKHSPYMGRSYGCPAVPKNESTNIINTIKNGTCLFIYHPGTNYLLGSKILND